MGISVRSWTVRTGCIGADACRWVFRTAKRASFLYLTPTDSSLCPEPWKLKHPLNCSGWWSKNEDGGLRQRFSKSPKNTVLDLITALRHSSELAPVISMHSQLLRFTSSREIYVDFCCPGCCPSGKSLLYLICRGVWGRISWMYEGEPDGAPFISYERWSLGACAERACRGFFMPPACRLCAGSPCIWLGQNHLITWLFQSSSKC